MEGLVTNVVPSQTRTTAFRKESDDEENGHPRMTASDFQVPRVNIFRVALGAANTCGQLIEGIFADRKAENLTSYLTRFGE
jgi:hypothetical protein